MTNIRNQVFLVVASLVAVGAYSQAGRPPQEIQDVEEQMVEQEEAMADMEADMRDVEADMHDMEADMHDAESDAADMDIDSNNDNDADDVEAGQ
jgi:hypothetical protein